MIRKHAPWLALLTALSPMWTASVASAQVAGTSGTTTTPTGIGCTGGVSCTVTAIGGETYTDTSYKIPVNKAQCDANADLHLSLPNIPTNTKYLEVWVGTDCQNGDRATRLGTMQCTFVNSKEKDPSTTIDTDLTIPVKPACDLGDGQRSYFILPVNTEKGTDTIGTFAKLTLNYDQTPPSAPTSLKGGAGQTEIKVSWTQPSDTYYFWVVVDTNVSEGAADLDSGVATTKCASQVLKSGADFDPNETPLPDGIWIKHINEKASTVTLNGEDFGIMNGEAAVAVMAEDLGHNRSVLSDVACLDIVPTTGFWQSYRDGGGVAEAGCACTAVGAESHGVPRGLCAVGVLALLWTARRARRRA